MEEKSKTNAEENASVKDDDTAAAAPEENAAKDDAAKKEDNTDETRLPTEDSGKEDEQVVIAEGGEAEKKAKLVKDKDYIAGRKIYLAGIIILGIILLLNALKFFMNIELFIGDMFVSYLTYFIYVIPCAVMLAGLFKTNAASRKYGVKGNDKTGIAFVTIGAALMISIGVFQIVAPTYHIYDVKDISVRPGQTLKVVEYMPASIFSPAPAYRTGEYCIDIYRADTVFARKLVSKEISFSEYVIKEGKDGNTYLLELSSFIDGETIPFRY